MLPGEGAQNSRHSLSQASRPLAVPAGNPSGSDSVPWQWAMGKLPKLASASSFQFSAGINIAKAYGLNYLQTSRYYGDEADLRKPDSALVFNWRWCALGQYASL